MTSPLRSLTDEPAAPLITPPEPGELDLEDRAALRRVAGMSTELQDISEVEYRELRLERVVLIGVWTEGTLDNAENSLRELSRLAETAGSQVLDGLIQRRGRPDPATYVGAGKAAELAEIVTEAGADTVICDGELSPSQLRRLEGVVRVKVIDRTALILDIFAQHARSKEGKAQVELAQLEYLLPRLRGWGESLSRQAGGRVAAGGGIGTRGPGETKIETDRRRIRTRTAKLRRELAGMATGREVQRGQRRRRAGAFGGDRRLHERRQVQPAQPGDRIGRPGGRLAVRHAGLGRAAGPDALGQAVHPDRHGGLRPAPAAPARRGVPRHARGGRAGRPDPARGGRLGPGPAGAARRRARGAEGDRRRRRRGARRGQQVGRGRPDRGPGRDAARAQLRRGLRPDRRGHRASCSRRWRGPFPGTTPRFARCCPTSAATCSRAPTRRAR